MKKSRFDKFLVLLLCITMVGTILLASCSKEPEIEEAPIPPHNALTGQTEDEGYDAAADNQRIVAFVVENSPDARPQWGLDDKDYSPDIVLQGEVEGGITRTLWFYADYNKLPEIIGPTRSARPPYIRFSEFFDSVFIHWGMSHSKGDYVGATTVFKKDNVDHINEMTLDDKEGLYGRDQTRNVSIEHRGIIYPEKLVATMNNEGIRMTPNEYTQLSFNQEAVPAGDTAGTQLGVKYSERAFEDTYWKYDESDGMYHTEDFENDFKRDNLLVLYDDTEYITKENYQGGGGGSVTYCDYKLTGGEGKLFSQGTVKDIVWAVEDNKLILKDPSIDATTAYAENEEAKAAYKEEMKTNDDIGPYVAPHTLVIPEALEGEEEEDTIARGYVVQKLNKGKTWIGWISRNNGGSVTVK